MLKAKGLDKKETSLELKLSSMKRNKASFYKKLQKENAPLD
jgi:hypothetical protein